MILSDLFYQILCTNSINATIPPFSPAFSVLSGVFTPTSLDWLPNFFCSSKVPHYWWISQVKQPIYSKRNWRIYIYWHLSYRRLRPWTVWSESCVLISYLSGQDGPILPARDCPRWSRERKNICVEQTSKVRNSWTMSSMKSQKSGGKSQTKQTKHMNKGGKFPKKLWCCVGGRVYQGNFV